MRGCSADSIRTRQTGVVLAITLLILLIVTVVGVSGMNASTIQFNLASNAYAKHESFQNAESTMLIGEIAWDEKLSNCLNDAANCTDDITPPLVDRIDTIDWDSISGEGDTIYGKYVVEYLGWRPVSGDNEVIIRLYRLTARGENQDKSSRTVIQTVYRKCTKADGVTCDG